MSHLARVNEFDLLKNEIQNRIQNRKIHKNADGIYKVSYTFPFGKRFTVRGTNAADIAHKLIEKRNTFLVEETKEKTLSVRFDTIAINWFKTEIEGRGLGDKNIKNHKIILNNHLIDEFGIKNINEITNSDIQFFLNGKGKIYSKSQVTKIKNCLVAIFNFAEANRIITYNPTVRLLLPKCKEFDHPNRKPVLDDEFTLALRAVKEDLQMFIILEILYVYGIRTIELINLKWKNISFKNNYIHIETSKYTNAITTNDAKSVMRFLPLSNIIADDLKTLKKQRKIHDENEYVFLTRKSHKKLETTRLDKYFHDLTRRMEIENGAIVFNNKIIGHTGVRHFTPYAFRHGVATKMDAMGYSDAISESFIGHKPRFVKGIHYSEMTFERELRPAYQAYMDKVETDLSRIINNI